MNTIQGTQFLALDEIRTYADAMAHLARNVTDYAVFLLDPQGLVTSWNLGAEKLSGYCQEEVLGKNYSMFFTQEAVAAGIPNTELAAAARDGRFEFQGWRQRKGGGQFWALVNVTAIRQSNGKLYGFAKITRDVTQQKALEEHQAKVAFELEERVKERTWQLEATANQLRFEKERVEDLLDTLRRELGEKEVLLREVYHRVKNNLQVVQSLLRMGGRTIFSGDGRAAIAAAVQRVQVMATVHERLYQMPDLASLNLSGFLPQIVEGVIESHSGRTNRIKLQMELDEVPLSLDLAIPFGLLVNELVSNCLKHGIEKDGPGTIRLSARIIPGAVRLVVHDNGRGLPKNFNASNSQSIGLKLVESLARQLGGKIEISSNDGCRVQADLARLLPSNESRQCSTNELQALNHV